MARRRRIRSRTTQARSRRPTTRQILAAVVALIVAITSFVDHLRRSSRDASPTTQTAAGDDRRRFDRSVGLVTKVVDGDTLDVRLDDGSEARVRLLGVDTPELHGSAGEFGVAASDYTKARASGRRVTLRLDELSQTRDRYQRLLAYVYLEGDEMLNEAIVRDGHGFAYRTYDCDFLQLIVAAENAARGAKRGLWRSITVAQMPEWRQRWLAERGLQ